MKRAGIYSLSVEDYQEVLQIDRACFDAEEQWSCQELHHLLSKCIRNDAGQVLGWCSCDPIKRVLVLARIGVLPEYQRMGVGTELVEQIKRKFRHTKRTHLMANVPEGNLVAQLFFKKQGFRAVLPIVIDEYGTSYYRMVWQRK
jgi:ribosomal-protein-alanine N-acetyltransferase